MQRFFFFFLLITIPFYNVKSATTFYPAEVFLMQDGDYFFHTVEPGQTVFSISRMYHLTEEDIYRLNPESREVIKIGAQLKIPQESGSYYYHTIQPKETLYSVSRMYQMKGEDIISVNPGLSVETFTIGKVIRIPTNRVTTPMTGPSEEYVQKVTEDLLKPSVEIKNLGTIRIALLLPFTSDVRARMVEYFEGFLLALEDIKKQGIAVHMKVHDIGKGTDSLPSLFQQQSMQNVHLIFGGLYNEQIRMIANFSREYDIPYVIPFNPLSDETMAYSTVYQANTPRSYMFFRASSAFCNKYRDAEIVFHVPSKPGNRADFVREIQRELKAKNIPYQVLTKDVLSVSDISTFLNTKKNTVFVPSDDGAEALSKLIIPLRSALDSNSQLLVSLFGYQTWQSYVADYLKDFSRFNATFFSNYYVNPASAKFKSFYNNYIRWYSKDLINAYPKYGLLGYDSGMFFIQALNRYGNTFAANIHQFKYSGIQIDFDLERVNNWGGFINTNVYFVDFLPNGTINSKSVK